MISLLDIWYPNTTLQGFSAYKSSLETSASVQFNDWSVSSPYFNFTSFNALAGNFTVSEAGRYLVQSTINYATDSAITGSLGVNVNPAFVLRRTSPSATDLISGLLPMININLLAVSLRSILGGGEITLSGELQLAQGDVIGLFFEADGMTLSLTI
jgi:hypothetical protein